MSGQLILTDEHCNVTTFRPGEGSATGLDVNLAIAMDATEFLRALLLAELVAEASILVGPRRLGLAA